MALVVDRQAVAVALDRLVPADTAVVLAMTAGTVVVVVDKWVLRVLRIHRIHC